MNEELMKSLISSNKNVAKLFDGSLNSLSPTELNNFLEDNISALELFHIVGPEENDNDNPLLISIEDYDE